MSAATDWTGAVLLSVLGAPTLAVLVLATARWATGKRASERLVGRLVSIAFGYSAVAGVLLGLHLLVSGDSRVEVDLGAWFAVGHYRFEWALRGDRLSLPFVIFCSGLAGVIAAFSRRYLHREDGFHRFYLMLAFFGVGTQLVVLAGTLDLVFFGWEIVGLTSALLIAFFHDRPGPVENGLRAFMTYRFCDVGMLGAAVWLHHSLGSSAIDASAEGIRWATIQVPPGASDAFWVGMLLLGASMGKAAQVPLGGWLPRAMEGPTPSSAIFYGAISVHLGPYLLLRSAGLLESDPTLGWWVAGIGATTALHATFVGRVQTDIKSALAYASMTQIGLIYVEIGFGLYQLALFHIVGHASLRSLQILRSPSLLHDHHHLEQSMGRALPRSGGHLERLVPDALQPWLYRAALERGYLDTLLLDWVAGGWTRFFRAIDRVEARWGRLLAGDAPERGAAVTGIPGEEQR